MTASGDQTPGGAIHLDAVTKKFGIYTAVDDISLTVGDNEFFTLLGPSGCGKTTLLRMLAGFEYPTRGRILVGGDDVTDKPSNQRPINTVFQSYALFPHMTVAENIGFGLRMQGKPREEIARTVETMLAMIHLTGRGDQLVTRLSGGQQQRVALARALAPKPRVLLLDEPLSALDLKLRKAMQIELKRLQAETGITFIFVTHDQEEALTMSDRIAVMREGRIGQLGTPRDIYDRPADRFVADFIGETNFLNVEVVDVASGQANVRLASGVAVTARCPEGLAATDPSVAVVRPEHAVITGDPQAALLTGTLRDVVYLGTDTHFHVVTSDGAAFVVRQQNSTVDLGAVTCGGQVGIYWPAGALQLVRA